MNLQEILLKVEGLQPLSPSAAKLMKVMNNPKSPLSEVVEVLRYDPAVTGQILRLCNSAAFGLARRVASVEEAVIYLGRSRTLGVATMNQVSGVLSRAQEGYGLAPRMLWKHSVGVALASEWLGTRINSPQQTWSFTAGLLHDIGKMVINEFVSEAMAEIVQCVNDDHLSFDQAERKVLGFSSDHAGAVLAEYWRLPEPIVHCIRHHLHPLDLPKSDPLVDTVYLANCVSMLMGIGLGDDGLYYRVEPSIAERYGLSDADFEECGIQMICSLMNIEAEFSGGQASSKKSGLEKSPNQCGAGARV